MGLSQRCRDAKNRGGKELQAIENDILALLRDLGVLAREKGLFLSQSRKDQGTW